MAITNNILVASMIKGNSALTPKAGDIVFKEILASLQKEQETLLDFRNVDFITTAFLNAAVGQLYSTFNSDYLNRFLKISINERDVPLLLDVIKSAQEYFADKKGFEDKLRGTVDE